MNSSYRATLLLRVLLLCALPTAVGCASSPPDRARDSAASMSSLESALGTLGDRIGHTLESLEQLSKKADAELRPEYDAFSKNLARLEATGKSVRSGATDMRAKARRHFEEWEKSLASIESRELRQLGTARRTRTMRDFDEADAEVDSLSREFEGILAKLNDIHTFLGHDLNTSAVQAIEDLIASAAKDGNGVRGGIPEVLARLAEVRAMISAEASGVPEA